MVACLLGRSLSWVSALPVQVYLTAAQRERIDALADAEGVTTADIVQRALDAYLQAGSGDPEAALARTHGAATDVAEPSRDEWQRS